MGGPPFFLRGASDVDIAQTVVSILDKYGLPIAALAAVAVFAWWAVRTLVDEQRRSNQELLKRLDRALDISERQTGSTDALAKVVHEALDNRGELMDLLEDAVGRLADLARRRP